MSLGAMRTESLAHDLLLEGFEPETDRLLRAADGRHLWIMNPPVARRWTATGRLVADAPVAWSLAADPAGTVVRCVGDRLADVEIDLVEMGPEAADALRADRSEPMVVLGSFASVGSPETLGRFLVGGVVLDATDFAGHRVISEQTALSLYRVARWRGGPFWELIAGHLRDFVVGRVQAAGPGGLIHDLWGRGESHARFVADAALLLLAEVERLPEDDSLRRAAQKALDLLDGFAATSDEGLWYRHDSLEVGDGRNDLVLNTHLQAVLVRLAAGLDVAEPMRALRSAIERPAEGSRAWVIGLGLRAANLVGLVCPRARALLAKRLGSAAVRAQRRNRRLVFPGGWIARDASGAPAPDYYLTVNLNDLAGVSANAADAGLSHVLERGLGFARGGHCQLELRRRTPTAVLVPNILRIAGDPADARRAAEQLTRAGFSPAIGWPGFEDRLWARLAAGTP